MQILFGDKRSLLMVGCCLHRLRADRMSEGFTSVLPFDTGQLERVFAQLAKRPPIHVHAVLSGNINTILKVECESRLYGLRVRTQEQVYRYEPDLVKEAFVTALLTPDAQPQTDAARADLFADVLTSRCGREWAARGYCGGHRLSVL